MARERSLPIRTAGLGLPDDAFELEARCEQWSNEEQRCLEFRATTGCPWAVGCGLALIRRNKVASSMPRSSYQSKRH